MTIISGWFDNVFLPILLAVMLACVAVSCVALTLWIWHEIKPEKGDDDKCR